MISEITKKRIIVIGIGTILILLIGWIAIFVMRSTKDRNTVVLDKGWTLRFNDKVTTDVDLSGYSFHDLKRLDTIEITRRITEDLSEGYTAKIKAQFCSLEVFVDGEKIYSEGTDKVANDEFLGSGYCFVELPADIQGKNLRIRLIVNEKDYMTDIGSIVLERTSEAMRLYANANATALYLNAFVLVFGVAMVIVGVLVKINGQECLTLILIGTFSVLIGHWAGCQGKIYGIFSNDFTKLSIHEFFCLYTAPIPLAVYIWNRQRKERGWRELVLRTAVIMLAAFDVVACILHATNLCRFPQTLGTFQVLGMVAVVAIMIAGVGGLSREKASDVVLVLAFSEISLSAILDFLRLKLQRYFFPSMDAIVEVSFLPLGAIMFVTLLTSSYLFSLYEMVLSHAERDALTKLAYHDPLTGLYNRAKANECLEELDAQDSEIAIVNFDVNGLKYVNDNFGHEEGDRLLKTVADAIEECFGGNGTNYRMSGDEFLCIVDPAGVFTLNLACEHFERMLKEASRNSRYAISASYGIAYRNKDDNRSIQDIYTEADEKMYAMKEKSRYSRQALEDVKNGNTEA